MIIGNELAIGRKFISGFTPYSEFLPSGLTSESWTSTDGTKTLTKAAGTWTVENNQLVANGSTYFNIAAPNSQIMYGLRCTIDSSFVPLSQANWYAQSCLMGCEISGSQQDSGITLVTVNNQVYPAFGAYSMTTQQTATKPITLGEEHTLFLLYTGLYYCLYMDYELVGFKQLTIGGTAITTYGVFWNKASSGTAVKGTISAIGIYTFNGNIINSLPLLR